MNLVSFTNLNDKNNTETLEPPNNLLPIDVKNLEETSTVDDQ